MEINEKDTIFSQCVVIAKAWMSLTITLGLLSAIIGTNLFHAFTKLAYKGSTDVFSIAIIVSSITIFTSLWGLVDHHHYLDCIKVNIAIATVTSYSISYEIMIERADLVCVSSIIISFLNTGILFFLLEKRPPRRGRR